MLAIARALIRDPKIILLDEPFEGLAPVIVRDLVEACRKLAADGQTILLVEQNLAATPIAPTSSTTAILCTKAPRRKSKRGRKYCTGTSASSHYPGKPPARQAIAATATMSSEMPTYFAVCIASGS